MEDWISVAESLNKIISHLRTQLTTAPPNPEGWLEQLQAGFEEAKKLKKLFNHKQRLLLLKQPAEFDERKPEIDHDDQTEVNAQRNMACKRRTAGADQEGTIKKKKNSGQELGMQAQPLIDPEIRPLFDAMHSGYSNLEAVALECRRLLPPDDPSQKKFDNAIWGLVFSSFIVIKHVPALFNVERKSQPHAIICALVGHVSHKLKDTMPIFAGLITEAQGRELKTTDPKLDYKVDYSATKPVPRKRTEVVRAVPLQWIEKDKTGTSSDPTGLYLASFYSIAVSKKDKTSPDGRRQRAAANVDGDPADSRWLGGYHLYFYTLIGDKGNPQKKFLTLGLPFEILRNYCGQKDRKWRDAVWRLGFCVNDHYCTAKKLDSTAPTIDCLMEILAYFFRGFVNTSLGLSEIHKICLKRYLGKFLKPKAEHIDYITFRDKFWSYFFKAVDYIKQVRFLWEQEIFHYCFLGRMEAEALLFQKGASSFLIRFQESEKAHGFPSLSILLPDKNGGPPFFAHSKLQEKINIRNYTLIHCLKYAQLERCAGNESKGKPVSQNLFDFEVFGIGKRDFGRWEPEDQNVYDRRDKNPSDKEPCFEYTDERRVVFPIRLLQGDNATLSKQLGHFAKTELGVFLSKHGGTTLEVSQMQLQQVENGWIPEHTAASSVVYKTSQQQIINEQFQQNSSPVLVPDDQTSSFQQHQENWPGVEVASEAASYSQSSYGYGDQNSTAYFSTEPSVEYEHNYGASAFHCFDPSANIPVSGTIEFDEYGQEIDPSTWFQTENFSDIDTRDQISPSELVTNASLSPINGTVQLQRVSQQDDNSRTSGASAYSPNMAFFGASPPYAPLLDSGASNPTQFNYNETQQPQNGYHQTPVDEMAEMRKNLIDWILNTPQEQIMERMNLLEVDSTKQ